MEFDMKIVGFVFKLYNFYKSFNVERFLLKRKLKKMPKQGNNDDLFVVLNGPSLKKQDLTLLKEKKMLFVNRGFMHPLYKELKPAYHLIIDPKLRDGQWPIEWLDEIFALSPNTKIILPINWYTHPRFSKYKTDKRIYWQHWHVPFYVMGVSGAAFSFGIYEKFRNIFFTGFDGDSSAYNLLKSSESHFYGQDPELETMTLEQHTHEYFTTFIQFNSYIKFSKYCRKRGINIYNITHGGVLDVFPRRDFNNPYDEQK